MIYNVLVFIALEVVQSIGTGLLHNADVFTYRTLRKEISIINLKDSVYNIALALNYMWCNFR
jgi:hypothetical protein